MPEVCDCADICKIPAGQPQPIASCRGLENQTPAASDLRDLERARTILHYPRGYLTQHEAELLTELVAAFAAIRAEAWDNAATQLENWGSPAEASALRRLAAHRKVIAE